MFIERKKTDKITHFSIDMWLRWSKEGSILCIAFVACSFYRHVAPLAQGDRFF